jgi:hypothetical protein
MQMLRDDDESPFWADVLLTQSRCDCHLERLVVRDTLHSKCCVRSSSGMELIQPLVGFVFEGPGMTSGVLGLDLLGFGSWKRPCSSMYCDV